MGEINPRGGESLERRFEAAAPDLSLFAAVEQQLGLKLESKKIERDTLVIDRAEKIPVEN